MMNISVMRLWKMQENDFMKGLIHSKHAGLRGIIPGKIAEAVRMQANVAVAKMSDNREIIKKTLEYYFQDLKIHIRNGRMVDAYEDVCKIESEVNFLLKDDNVSSD